MYEAYGKQCLYCGRLLEPKDMQIDHILATKAMKSENQEFIQYLSELSANGFKTEKPNYIENYCLCCEDCNSRKRNCNFDVSKLRLYHEMAAKKTEEILCLIEKYKSGGNTEEFQPVPNEPLE